MKYNFKGKFDPAMEYAKYDAIEFGDKVWWCGRPVKGKSPADKAASAVWHMVSDPTALMLKSGGSASFSTDTKYTELHPRQVFTVASGEVQSADLAGTLKLEAGNTYRVFFDGSYYTCKAFEYSAWGAVCVGNGSLIGASEGNGEPFVIARYASYAANINVMHPGTHTVGVEEVQETYTPIAPEYLAGEKPGANQYLVTDSNGNTGWAERLAWEEKLVIT